MTCPAALIRATSRRVSGASVTKTYFGYKAYLAVDEESGRVRQAEMTSANVHDSRLGEALIQGDEQGYFADRAYDSQALRETLERRAWSTESSGRSSTPAIRSSPGKSFTTPGREACAQRSSAPFATMKRWYGMERRPARARKAKNCRPKRRKAPPHNPTKPVLATSTHRFQPLGRFCKALCAIACGKMRALMSDTRFWRRRSNRP